MLMNERLLATMLLRTSRKTAPMRSDMPLETRFVALFLNKPEHKKSSRSSRRGSRRPFFGQWNGRVVGGIMMGKNMVIYGD